MDLNEDGYRDLLSGSYSRMSQPMAGLFQVLWGQPDGSFKPAEVLLGADDEPLIIPADAQTITENICTRPTAIDWDADGDLDLVVGNFAGSFYLFTGQGKGTFAAEPEKILTDNGPLQISGAHSDPFPIDWDDDGDLDLLSGSHTGDVQWAENVADPKEKPKFTGFRPLIRQTRQIQYGQFLSEDELFGPATSSRVWVDDFNGDGKLDVLVGDSVTLVSLPAGMTKKESKKREAEWQEAVNAASAEYTKAADEPQKQAQASLKLQAVYAQRTEFIVEDRTGFVWLYLQE